MSALQKPRKRIGRLRYRPAGYRPTWWWRSTRGFGATRRGRPRSGTTQPIRIVLFRGSSPPTRSRRRRTMPTPSRAFCYVTVRHRTTHAGSHSAACGLRSGTRSLLNSLERRLRLPMEGRTVRTPPGAAGRSSRATPFIRVYRRVQKATTTTPRDCA